MSDEFVQPDYTTFTVQDIVEYILSGEFFDEEAREGIDDHSFIPFVVMVVVLSSLENPVRFPFAKLLRVLKGHSNCMIAIFVVMTVSIRLIAS